MKNKQRKRNDILNIESDSYVSKRCIIIDFKKEIFHFVDKNKYNK